MAGRSSAEIKFAKVLTQLNAALACADTDRTRKAILDAITMHNVSELARSARSDRASLYRSFGKRAYRPNLSTVLNVLAAMGLQLKVANVRKKQRAKRTQGLPPGKLQ
jgi:DNA-binding phage protein